VFAVDLLMWFVSGFSLLILACSTVFVIYFCIRTILETVFLVLSPEYKNSRTKPRGIGALNTVSTAGPWGPIDQNLSTETAEKIERIMAIGRGMRDRAGNPCPHPIAPRVALAIVEALQPHR
jgi:hypothetical protein